MSTPKIGLALGSGAARGFAHIGVIKVLQENNIPIDYVAGSSIGAVIGALFCSGADFDLISKVLEYINTKNLIDLSITRQGLIKGEKIEEYLKLIIRAENFDELKIPLKVVSTDIQSGEKVIFDKGDIVKAIRASISIPGIFTPVNIDGKILIDGGVAERLPSKIAKDMGSDIVIGVDVGYKLGDDYKPNTIFDIILQSIGIIEAKNFKYLEKDCDVLVNPEVKKLNAFGLDNVKGIINSGRIAMESKLHDLKKIIKKCSIIYEDEHKVLIKR